MDKQKVAHNFNKATNLRMRVGFKNKLHSLLPYNNMPLVHYSEQDGKSLEENDHLRFHWEKPGPDVAKDIEVAKNESGYHMKNQNKHE